MKIHPPLTPEERRAIRLGEQSTSPDSVYFVSPSVIRYLLSRKMITQDLDMYDWAIPDSYVTTSKGWLEYNTTAPA